MAIPPGVSNRDWQTALQQFVQAVGESGVFTSDEDIGLYRDAYSPLWEEPEERLASAAIAPTTTEQVSEVVRVANRFRIPIFPIATGRNLGYGGSAPNLSGSVVVDLKRMNRVIEVDDRRHFAIVEPGVSYFDLYRHIQDRGLKVWIDCPDPGWGSPLGNALDHGVGYTFGAYRDHFHSHCGLEAVLPNGDVIRTGMGALPGAKTWAEYRYGFGPTVDGLFAQGNVGIVTKMGFHLLPAPEAYQTSVVTVPRRNDIVPLIGLVNELEHAGLIGQPGYGSPLAARRADLEELLKRPGGPPAEDLDRFAQEQKLGSWTCRLQFYGAPAVIAAHIAYAKDRFTRDIPGATFEDGELLRFPLTQEQLDSVRKVAVGIPNLAAFGGRRGSDGHLWFAPVIPKTGEAVLEAQRVFMDVFARRGGPALISPFSMPATWMYRAFVFLMGFPISRSDVTVNQRTRETMREIIKVAAEHGWGEYRAAPAFQDDVMAAYSYNNSALLRLHETIKDAIDPNGIMAAGRSGIWPRHLRGRRA
ncbi:MAG: FAD-binding oxidoreductase [Acidobacteria bacterium]|nr:FAD-binding oxidoreductase [Acidobacteriota bacterium]